MQFEQQTVSVSPTTYTTVPLNAQLSTLLQYGGGATATILAIAVLIKALAELLKVFVPVMMQRSYKK